MKSEKKIADSDKAEGLTLTKLILAGVTVIWRRLLAWIIDTFFNHFTFEKDGKVKKKGCMGLWAFLFQFLFYLRYRAYGNAFCNIMLFLIALFPYYLFNHIMNPTWILPYAGIVWSAYLLLRNMYMTTKMSEIIVHEYYCFKKEYIITG